MPQFSIRETLFQSACFHHVAARAVLAIASDEIRFRVFLLRRREICPAAMSPKTLIFVYSTGIPTEGQRAPSHADVIWITPRDKGNREPQTPVPGHYPLQPQRGALVHLRTGPLAGTVTMKCLGRTRKLFATCQNCSAQ